MAAVSAVAATAMAGIILQAAAAPSVAAALSIFGYFTIQSNVGVAAVALVELAALARGRRPGRGLAVARGWTLLAIGVTGIVFLLMLSSVWRPSGIQGVANVLLHYASPAAAFAYWAAFAEKGLLRPRDGALWLAHPLLYMAGAEAVGAFTGRLPYWFLNPYAPPPEGLGSWRALALVAVVMAAAMAALAQGIVLADRLAARLAARGMVRRSADHTTGGATGA